MMRWISQLVRRTVVVHLVDGQSLRGVMVGEYKDAIVLRHGEYLGRDGITTVDGEAVVPRERIGWIQVTGEGMP